MLNYDLDADFLVALPTTDLSEFCDEALDTDSFIQELDLYLSPFGRKGFCEFAGIAPSTLSGWIKDQRMPLWAKELYVLVRSLEVLRAEIKRLNKDFTEPMVLEMEAGYGVCIFRPDEDGAIVGQIVASGIKDLKTARHLASSTPALRMLNQAVDVVDEMAEKMEDTGNLSYHDDLTKLARRIKSQITYVADYDAWKSLYGENRFSDIDLDNLIADLAHDEGTDKDSTDAKYRIELPDDQKVEASTLGDLLVGALKILQERDPAFLDQLSKKGGRVRRIVAKDPKALYPLRPDLAQYSREVVKGWHVATNNSRRDVDRILRVASEVAGLTYGVDLKVTL